MVTDDWIEEIYENRVKVGIFPRLMMKELIDEIKRLRAELAAFTEGMPETKRLRFSSETLREFGDGNIDDLTACWLDQIAAMKREIV